MPRNDLKGLKLCPHGVLIGSYCEDCADIERAQALYPDPPAPMHAEFTCWVRVFFKHGAGHADIPMQGAFQLGPWLALVKGSGGIMSPVLHIPWENILCFCVINHPQNPTLADGGLEQLHIPGRAN